MAASLRPPLVPPAITAPIVVPTGIAPMARAPGFDPAWLGRGGAPNSRASGSADVGWQDTGTAATLSEVDEPVTYLDGPLPVYPAALHQVGVEGWVELRYIVGLDGRAEPHSIEIVRSSNAGFDVPAIDAIKGSRFRTARLKGRPVRQLVEQIVRFRLH
jgi:protein TonB